MSRFRIWNIIWLQSLTLLVAKIMTNCNRNPVRLPGQQRRFRLTRHHGKFIQNLCRIKLYYIKLLFNTAINSIILLHRTIYFNMIGHYLNHALVRKDLNLVWEAGLPNVARQRASAHPETFVINSLSRLEFLQDPAV